MTDEDFMKLAIQSAKDAEASGGAAIGAIMVKDGEVIAKGWSNPYGKRDPSNHVRDDNYIIEQINAAHIGDVVEGNVTACQIGGCALRCVTTNENGILSLINKDGEALCE